MMEINPKFKVGDTVYIASYQGGITSRCPNCNLSVPVKTHFRAVEAVVEQIVVKITEDGVSIDYYTGNGFPYSGNAVFGTLEESERFAEELNKKGKEPR